ncbi:MAG: hypothetical protein KGM47_01715 [Acidobacteriota bacterium]|nr:hypothetical protein [Acidobacteriota bacterium]
MDTNINPDKSPVVVNPPEKSSHTGIFIAIFVILALLIIGEFYSMGRFSSLRTQLRDEQSAMNKQLSAEVTSKLQDLQTANSQSLDQLRTELDSTATSMSANEKKAIRNSHYAGAMVRRLQKEQAQNTQQLQTALATKADSQTVGSLTQDVSATKTDLTQTKKTMNTLVSDLGMARSSMGTLIATNHQDIVALQKLGSRDYYEFTLNKNEKKTVASVALTLKHASDRHHTYNVDMFYNDMKITRKNLAIDQPVFFAPKYTHNFYEMVVYQVGPNWVKGYISTPKGALQEVASSAN